MAEIFYTDEYPSESCDYSKPSARKRKMNGITQSAKWTKISFQKRYQKQMKKVLVGDQEFESVAAAAKHFKLSGPTVSKYAKENGIINGMTVRFKGSNQ